MLSRQILIRLAEPLLGVRGRGSCQGLMELGLFFRRVESVFWVPDLCEAVLSHEEPVIAWDI